MKVMYLGHYREGSGWSKAATDLILALDSVGIDVACRNIPLTNNRYDVPDRVKELESKPVDGSDYCIQHLLPHHLIGSKRFKKNISYFVSESTSIKATSWFENLQQMDEVWVANNDLRNSLTSDNLFDDDSRVKFVPHAFNMEKYGGEYNTISIPNVDGKFKFYFIGELNDRKNLASIIKCFHSEFDISEPVSLIIKVKRFGVDPQAVVDAVRGMSNDIKSRLRMYPNIDDYHSEIIIGDEMSNEGICSLHQYGDCFVSPSHGEGWSIPSFDSMCFGTTPICSKFGGPSDFIDGVNTGTKVDGCYSVCDTSDSAFPHLFTGREDWFTPSEAEIKKAMRYYFENRDRVDRKAGLKQGENFSYKAVGNLMKEYLEG